MWAKFWMFLTGINKFFLKFLETEFAIAVANAGPYAAKVVRQVEASGVSGSTAKALKAYELILMDLPGIAMNVAKTAIEIAVGMMNEGVQEEDSDGDGVPDVIDSCPTQGKPPGGCVTADGCPDSDCDGTPDHLDPCPQDPACK
jgi:hypothetical protein